MVNEHKSSLTLYCKLNLGFRKHLCCNIGCDATFDFKVVCVPWSIKCSEHFSTFIRLLNLLKFKLEYSNFKDKFSVLHELSQTKNILH